MLKVANKSSIHMTHMILNADKVKKLGCFIGVKTHVALSLIVETGDFYRFAKGNIYAGLYKSII